MTSEGKPNSQSALAEKREGTLALTCMFGKSFILTHEELEDSANKAIQIIDMLMLKNNPLFEKFVNTDKDKLYIQGVGTLPFLLEVKIESLDEK